MPACGATENLTTLQHVIVGTLVGVLIIKIILSVILHEDLSAGGAARPA